MKTKTFEVELRMFKKGEIRKVEVPVNKLGKDVEHDLEMIFFHGQNDIHALEQISVSAGDIIRYDKNRFLIKSVGFLKITDENRSEIDKEKTPEEKIREIFAH